MMSGQRCQNANMEMMQDGMSTGLRHRSAACARARAPGNTNAPRRASPDAPCSRRPYCERTFEADALC